MCVLRLLCCVCSVTTMLCDTDVTMRSCSPTQGHTPFNSHQWRWVDIRVCYVQAVSQLSSFNLKLQFRWRQYTLTQYPLHTHTMHAIYPMTKDCRIVGTIVIFTTAHSHRRSHTHSPRMLKSHTQDVGGGWTTHPTLVHSPPTTFPQLQVSNSHHWYTYSSVAPLSTTSSSAACNHWYK